MESLCGAKVACSCVVLWAVFTQVFLTLWTVRLFSQSAASQTLSPGPDDSPWLPEPCVWPHKGANHTSSEQDNPSRPLSVVLQCGADTWLKGWEARLWWNGDHPTLSAGTACTECGHHGVVRGQLHKTEALDRLTGIASLTEDQYDGS